MDIPVSLRTEIPILQKPLLFRLIFRCALDSLLPKLADRVLLGVLLDWMRLSLLRFRLFVKCHSNHLLSCRVFVRSAFIHSQPRVEYAQLLLDIVHRVAEEPGISREAKLLNLLSHMELSVLLSEDSGLTANVIWV